jgi:hypothetical protein
LGRESQNEVAEMKWLIIAVMLASGMAWGQGEYSEMPITLKKFTLGLSNASNVFDYVVGAPKASVFGTPLYYNGSIIGNGSTVYATQTYLSKYDWWRTAYTISVWIFPFNPATTANPIILGNMDPNSGTDYWSGPAYTPVDKVNPGFFYYSGAVNKTIFNIVLATNRWSHCVITFNPTAQSMTCYVDGVIIPVFSGSASWAGKTPQSSTGTTLALMAFNNARFNGRILNLTIYNAVLSHAQVQALASERPKP